MDSSELDKKTRAYAIYLIITLFLAVAFIRRWNDECHFFLFPPERTETFYKSNLSIFCDMVPKPVFLIITGGIPLWIWAGPVYRLVRRMVSKDPY
ncbi:MAG: hypothetical protein SchgKO_21490 [Schleiferiaceae bacterium]